MPENSSDDGRRGSGCEAANRCVRRKRADRLFVEPYRGAAFIEAFAAQLKLPVVVNVSQRMNAGAHDGKSSLEVAFDAFSDPDAAGKAAWW